MRSNVGRLVRFNLDGVELVRRLVNPVNGSANGLSVESPVGRVLSKARVGDRVVVQAPVGDVVVKVLEFCS